MDKERERGGTAEIAADGRQEAERDTRQPDRMEGQPVEERQLPQEQPADGQAALLDEEAARGFRDRWQETQASFVDDPRTAVEEADTLVADVIQDLASRFAEARAGLEEQWDRGDDVSTEELRLVLQQYRSFFGRLLQV